MADGDPRPAHARPTAALPGSIVITLPVPPALRVACPHPGVNVARVPRTPVTSLARGVTEV